MRQASAGHAMWLIARLRLRRLWNMSTRFQFGRKKAGQSRAATPAKKGIGALLAVTIGALMLLTVLNMARQSALNIQCFLEPASACLVGDSAHELRLNLDAAAQELHAAPFRPAALQALTMQLSLLFLASILLPLSGREIAAADWDLEWLVTLPAKRSTLLWGRILERTLANPTGWILLTPCGTMLAWYAGFGWSAPLAGLGGAVALLPLAAMLRTLADTGLRMSLAPSQLRNVQALTAITGLPLLYLALAFAAMNSDSPVIGLARQWPEGAQWLPPGLLIKAMAAVSPAQAVAALALLALECAGTLWLGMRMLRHQLRDGVVASGVRETSRSAAPAKASALAFLLPRSTIKRRELRLLGRDRNFMIQSLLVPVMIVGGQMVFTNSASAIADMAASPTFLAGMAFGIGSYMLMLSAFQTLNNEGPSLWMLYTVPRSIESVLKEKAEFWGALALIYPLLILVTGLWLAPGNAVATLGLFAVVLAGIPIFATIAVALGVFGCDPLAQDARSKVRPGYLYLYMMLSGLYIYTVTAAPWPAKLVLMVLMAALAIALWQKARDQLPYLLDPAASPPARVCAADGLIAATLFFVLQGVFVLGLVKLAGMAAPEALVAGFAASGLLVFSIMRLVYWLAKTSGVPPLLHGKLAPSLGWGLGGGLAAGALGLAYMTVLARWNWFPDARLGTHNMAFALHWLVLLALVAAPLCEEFIFRGLVFGGLRRSMGLAPAMLMSAALFAIVHPPASVLPVFVLGLCAAYVYERSRALLAPVLVHALYNGMLLAWQSVP
ncbi:MAG: type II CAAX endopeptidase family protein [Pseudomonadota bacterium]